MNKAYSWDDYVYDCLMARNEPTINNSDVEILEVCYNHCYREYDAMVAVIMDRSYRR